MLFDRPIGTLTLGTSPLTFTPRIRVTAQAHATARADANLSVSAGGNIHAPFGFEYTQTSGFRVLDPIRDGTRRFQFDANATADIELGAGVTLRGSLDFAISIAGLDSFVSVGNVSAGADVKMNVSYKPLEESACLTGEATFTPFVSGEASAKLDASMIGLGRYGVTLGELGHRFGSLTLYSYSDNGRYCLDDQARLAAEMSVAFSRDCNNPADNPFHGRCVEEMRRHCFDPPANSCQGYLDEGGNVLMLWSTGERIEIRSEQLEGSKVDYARAFGVDGELCVTQTLEYISNTPGPSSIGEPFIKVNMVLEQSELPDDVDEIEEEDLQARYDSGELREAGEEASWQLFFSSPSSEATSGSLQCPNEEGSTTFPVSVRQRNGFIACPLGVSGCSFQSVDEMPEASLSVPDGSW